MKKIILLFFLIFFSKNTLLQAQEREGLFFYNVGLGALVSGVGAIINKQPQEKLGVTFLNGFWKGAIGGYLVYESKNILGNIGDRENYTYAWGAKLLNASGTSIIENGAANRQVWERWHLHIGFNRLEFNVKDNWKVTYKIMPVSLLSTVYSAIDSKFEIKRSMQIGEFVFSKSRVEKNAGGYVLANAMVIQDKRMESYTTIAHEMVHIYQYYDYNFVNVYLNRPKHKWRKNSSTFNGFSKIFYIDVQAAVLRPLYLLEGGLYNDYYYDNFFEYEAEFFSNKGYVRPNVKFISN
ncbi:MAG: hypothetical protein ACTJGD_00685 [Mesonia hippocampi]|uniref:hypothetical protein n=1 Tax=Mesonia hippocampi TaxID=1628250 RepID=UPI003F97A3E1